MGKQVDQGTRWESRIVNGALSVGRKAMRMPKTGKKHEPDLMITGTNMRPAVAWEKWSGKKSDGRRRATRMVTFTEDHFKELLDLDVDNVYGYLVQCKSTQAGALSTWLEGLIDRMEQDGDN